MRETEQEKERISWIEKLTQRNKKDTGTYKEKELEIQEKQLKFSFVFENIAMKEELPKKEQMSVVATKLSRKAQLIYNNLDKPEDYDFVKASFVHAYSSTPDG